MRRRMVVRAALWRRRNGEEWEGKERGCVLFYLSDGGFIYFICLDECVFLFLSFSFVIASLVWVGIVSSHIGMGPLILLFNMKEFLDLDSLKL